MEKKAIPSVVRFVLFSLCGVVRLVREATLNACMQNGWLGHLGWI